MLPHRELCTTRTNLPTLGGRPSSTWTSAVAITRSACPVHSVYHYVSACEREGGRERGREGGREGGRERWREGRREGGREGGYGDREGGYGDREGGYGDREGGDGGREGGILLQQLVCQL